MPYSIRLPDGSIVANIPDDMPLSEARNRIEKSRPELAKYAEERQGFMPALKAGLERIKGEAGLVAGKTGLLSLKEAEAYKKEKEEQAARIHTPTEKGWTEAPLTKFTETLGGSLPYMAAPAAAGLASMALPLSGAAAGLAAAGASGLVSAGQFTGSNLARQMDTGKSLEEASLGKAVAAAIPQAAIDTIAGRMLPGIGKVFGAAGVKVTAETAEQIAKQSMMRVAGDYVAATGKAVTTEGLTEAAQQVLERLQAGLKIADPEARKEYFDSFIGGAVLGGAIAPAGRYMERAKIAAGPEKAVEPPTEEKVPATPQSEEKVPARPLDEMTYEGLVQLRERLLQEPKSKERAGKLKEIRAELLKSDEEFTKREQASRAKAAESAFNQPDQEVLPREGLDVEALRKEAEVAEPTLRKKPEAALPQDLHPNLTLDAFGDKPGYYTWAKSKPGRAFIQTALDTAPEDRMVLAGTSPAKAKVLELMFPEGEAAAPAVEPTATAPMVEPTATEPTVEPEAEPAFTEQREDIVSEETQTGFEGLDDASFATEKARVDAALAEHDATKPKGKGSKAAMPAWEEARRPLASAASLAFDEQMRRNEAARAEPTVEPEAEAWEDTKRYRDAQAEWDEEWAYESDAPKFAAFTPMQQRKIADKLEARTLDEDQYQAFVDEAPEPGEAPALSRTQRTGAGLQKNEVGSIVDAIRSKWENAPDVAVVESMDDPEVPQAVRDYDQQQRATGATGEPEAFWYKGKAYFVANQMRSPTDVMRSMFHEILGHYGLRGTFGKALDPILKQIADARRAEVEAKAKEYGLDMGDEAQRLQAAEEVLANLAQTKPDISFVKRAVAAIRSWLRQNIPAFQNMKLTDAEIINDFILPARRFVDQGAKAPVSGKAAFSRATQPTPQGPVYTVDPDLMERAQQTIQEQKTPAELAKESAKIVKGVFTDPVGSMTALRTTLADRWATVEQRLQRSVDGVRKSGSERAAGVIIARQAEDLNKLIPSFLYNGKLAVDDLTKLLKVEKLLDKDGNPINPVQIYDVLGRLAKKLNMTEQQASAYASTVMEGRRLQALITEAKTNPDIEVQIHWRKADKSIDYAKIKRAAQIYDATPEFKELANIMDEPRKALMNELIKAGWIDKETGETMRDVAYYVPFDRMTNEQLSAFGESFKKNFRDSKKRGVRGIAHVGRMPELKGAFDRPVGNVFDNYFKTLTWLSTELAKQNATTQILKDMSELGYARYLGQNRAKAKTDYVVTNFIDGVPHYFELPSQYDYVAFLDRSPPKGWFVRNMSNIAGMLRTTITANPVFAASQVVQDIQGALLLADVKNPSRFVREALGNFASLTWHELKNIPKYAKGEHAHHHAIEKVMADRGLTGEVDYTVSNPALDIQYSLGLQKRRALGSTTVGAILHGFKQITNASDLAVRKALYDDAERVTHDAMLAGTKARELINFRRRGANGLVRDLVAMVPFFNAHIQSMDILWREATGQGASITGLNRNQAKLKLMKMMGLYATFAATYAMLRNGDDDYDNMDERTKNNNWLFSGEEGGIRIPIRKDLAFVKVAIENAVDWYKRQGTAEERLAKEAIATTLAYALETYAGGYMPVPAALKPLIENMTNYSLLTGRELVGTYQKGLDKHLQETSTTSEASKGIARFLKDTFDLEMSPILLDNALRGYFGTTGATVAGLTDMMLNPDSPDRPMHKMMAVGAFAWDKTQLTAEKGEFYDLAEKVLTAKRSYDSVKDTDPDYADKLYDRYEAEISLAPIVNSTLEQLSNIRKAVKVYKSPAAKEYMSRDEIQTALDAALEEERMIVDYIRELRAETGL